eukprot:scaffold24980_cov117-Cylindrotheca_fusiformis.AAC.1
MVRYRRTSLLHIHCSRQSMQIAVGLGQRIDIRHSLSTRAYLSLKVEVTSDKWCIFYKIIGAKTPKRSFCQASRSFLIAGL